LENGDFTTYRLTDLTQVHRGAEFDFEYRPDYGKWRLRGYGSIGNWEYDGTTPYTLQNDETFVFIEEGEIDLTGTKVGNAPQTSFGAGFSVDIIDNLSIDGDYNIYTDLYGFVDPADVVEAAFAGEGTFQSERLPAYTLADAGITYKFFLGDNRLTFRGNVYNVFNEAYINQKDAFGVFLGIGRTYNASLRYNF
jgi:outer membrane receptor protein involved in Fe transport